MGLFDNLFRRKQEKIITEYVNDQFATFTAYTPVFRDWNGALYESELVRASVDTIARHIAKLKIEYKGSAQPDFINRLKKGICPWMTDAQFLYKTATMLYMTNTVFILPVYDNKYNVLGYFPEVPTEWQVKIYKDDYWIRMKMKDRSWGAVKLNSVGIMTRFQYQDLFFGDQMTGLENTMKLINLQNQATEENVRNGATYRFYGQATTVMKPSDLAKERERFTEDNLTNKKNNGGFLLFPAQYKDIKQVVNNPYSIDTNQLKLIKENVHDYYGVNTDLIQNHADSQTMDSFFNGCIEWFSIQMGEVLRNLIFTWNERSYGNDVFLVANRLQYMSTNQKIALARDFGDRGILTKNEIRELLNFAPTEDGDVAFIRGEYFTTDAKIGNDQEEDNGTENTENDRI